MTPRSRAWVTGRLLAAGFCWLTAAYACVASSTFATLQFLQPRVFPWVGTFGDWHPAASWVWLAVAGALSWHDVRRRDGAHRVVLGLLLLLAAGVAWSSTSHLLASLAGGTRPLVVAFVAFAIPIAFAVIDHLVVRSRGSSDPPLAGLKPRPRTDDESRLLVVGVASALLV